MLNNSAKEMGWVCADYQSRIYPASVPARRASSSDAFSIRLFNFRHLPSQQHTTLCQRTSSSSIAECRQWAAALHFGVLFGNKTMSVVGSRERDNKMIKTSGNGRKRQQEERLGIAA